jgi:hypothetical protein
MVQSNTAFKGSKQNFCVFFTSFMQDTCPAHIILFDLSVQTVHSRV